MNLLNFNNHYALVQKGWSLTIQIKLRKINIILACFFCVTVSYAQLKHAEQLREGDLLFQNLNCGPLCEAIKAVTYGVNNKSFSHCAIVVKINDTLEVIEAIGKAVQINSVHDFFARSGDTGNIKNITIARLKEDYKKCIAKAIRFTKKQVGKPYDDEFILNNGAWYCSELIYEAFKYANHNKSFFLIKPMTFKDPSTKQFFPAWVEYYNKIHQQIPEGKPGINPGLISRSKKIIIIK